MKSPPIDFDTLPSAATSKATLKICLKCAFDFFTKQLGLAPRTAYSELKKHSPEAADLTGSATARPHFFDTEGADRCPYCNAAKRWLAEFHATRIDAHPAYEKQRKKIWTALKKQPQRFTLLSPPRTPMHIFSEWLERLNRDIDLEGDAWLYRVAAECAARFAPAAEREGPAPGELRRVRLSRELDAGWDYDNGTLYLSPIVYGDVLLVQHLLSRSHLHGGRSLEGRLTLPELLGRLRRIGHLEARGIQTGDHYEAFEEAVAAAVDSGPRAVYYAVDRGDYLAKLKSIYDRKRRK